MESLSSKECIPCKGGVPALPEQECQKLFKELNTRWELREDFKRLKCEIQTKDFRTAFELAHKIATLSEEQQHHPVLTIGFGHLTVEIWTHKIDALVESDFIFAAKVDKILEGEL